MNKTKLLLIKMDLVRRICKLGHEARSIAGIKLRQPLSKVLVHINEDVLLEEYGMKNKSKEEQEEFLKNILS